LHEKGSSGPLGLERNKDKIKFHSLFRVKDLTPIILILVLIIIITSNYPNHLGDVENFNPANPLVAPIHIQPEWYFLFAYVILRSIPSKLGGVVALLASILILGSFVAKKGLRTKFIPVKKLTFWLWISSILVLTWIGAKTVESPYEGIGQVYSTIYFIRIMLI